MLVAATATAVWRYDGGRLAFKEARARGDLRGVGLTRSGRSGRHVEGKCTAAAVDDEWTLSTQDKQRREM